MTVRVEGLRELHAALKRAEGDLDKGLRDELKEIGQVVADESRSRFSHVSPRSAAGFKPRVRGSGRVDVAQSLRRTTGKRGDYGAHQMRRALIPALDAKEGEIVRRLDRMLDHVADRFN